jgi:hypothetical protein
MHTFYYRCPNGHTRKSHASWVDPNTGGASVPATLLCSCYLEDGGRCLEMGSLVENPVDEEVREILATRTRCERWSNAVRSALGSLCGTEPTAEGPYWRFGIFVVQDQFNDNSGGRVVFAVFPDGGEALSISFERWEDERPQHVADRIFALMRRIESDLIFQYRQKRRGSEPT